jgi:type VI secretion system secreted protein VgrG
MEWDKTAGAQRSWRGVQYLPCQCRTSYTLPDLIYTRAQPSEGGSMILSQQDRTLSIATPLGEDVLLLRSMSARESLGTLFEYELVLISEDINLRHEQLLGQPATVRLTLPDSTQRYFNGIVNRFSYVGFDGAAGVYHATLVPWAWFLTRTADCRIFQNKTVPDIVKEIFREHGFTDFEERLGGEYREWIYCVQYRETDFNFISRLLEQEGVYYYFIHENGRHKFILADNYSAHSTVPGYEAIPYYPPDETALREREHIDDWSVASEVQPGVFSQTDFDFKAPKKDLLTKCSNPKEHDLADSEIFDYPGEYLKPEHGETYTRIRLEEAQADYQIARAEGNARGLTTGALFSLTNYRREDQNGEYLIVSADYQLESDLFGSSSQAERGPIFRCSITAMDSKTPYRPPRITPKPVVQGPQTAIVVGKAGEEIWTEEYGQVKVQFFWDRYGKFDENSSCWVRVSHPWAGKSWGAVAIPRIGQEVIVDFLEGDPDQPIITGRVYNKDTMPPYGLPAGAVISGIKSNSTKGGGGYNEFVMDDTKGNELIREHAQYNKDTTVEHDQTLTVHNNRTIKVDGTHTETIDGDTKITVSKGNYDHKIATGTGTYYVKGAVKETYDNKQETTIANELVIKSTGSHVHVTAATEIKLEVGASTLLMKSDGSIKLDGIDIAINGISINIHGVSVTSQADADNNTKGAIVISEGAASNTVKGGMVMLNP